MSDLTLEIDQFLRSVEISKTDFFTTILGAGASISSGIKSASDCIWEWKRDIYATKAISNSQLKLDDRSEQVRETIQNWLNSENSYPLLNSVEEYSFYVEKCYPIEADRQKYFKRLCEKKEPSVGYKLLCLLYESGLIKSVWTTNFDDLCRDAAIKTSNTVIDVTLDSVDRVIRPLNNSEMLLIKLHGDYKYGPLKNTDSELKTQDETFRNRLIDYLNDKHLIVSGYSGRDESIMAALKESYAKRGSGRLYWCGYGHDIPPSVRKLLEVARANGRDAYYIPTDGFDKLMISLSKIVCRDDQSLLNKYAEYLKGDQETIIKSPFKIDTGNLHSIIKGNLFPIKLPQEAFQFESDLATGPHPWKSIKELVKPYNIVAVPFKGYVWALGTLTDINQCFADQFKSSIVRVPIKGLNLWKDTAIYNLLLTALTKALASPNGLRSNGKDLIWKSATTSNRIIQNVLYSTHEAVRLSLSHDGKRHYLSLEPDFRIETADSDQRISKEIRQDVGRTYFDKLRNNFFDEYIKGWRKLLFTGKEDKFVVEYPVASASGFSFEIYRLPLFAKIFKSSSNAPLQLSADFPKQVLHFKGLQFAEPELEFSSKYPGMNVTPVDFHPMRGLTRNSPYDSGLTGVLFDNKINLAAICPSAEAQEFSNFLKLEVVKIGSNKVNEDYLIDYPGFFDAYGVSLNVPDVNSENWFTCPEPLTKQTLQETAFDLRDKVINRIDQSLKNEIKKVLVIYIPDILLRYSVIPKLLHCPAGFMI